MRNSKILFLTFIFLMPFLIFNVSAKDICDFSKIEVEDVSVKEKSNNTIEVSKAEFKDNKINLDLKMFDVGDYIEYKIKIKNTSADDYYFDNNLLNINSNYFDYSLVNNDGSNIVKGNSDKVVYLKVVYKKEVEEDKYFSGKYIDQNILSVSLNGNDSLFSNPLTNSNIIILLSIILLVILVTLFSNKIRKNRLYIFVILGLTVLLPINIYALCMCRLEINSDITIGKVKPTMCTFDGELVQGAEYVNGQYTYRYMQESNYSDWSNIDDEGWGVMLTDKNSSDAVTTTPCTYINNKPVVSMKGMFYLSKARSIDLSKFDTSTVKNMEGMFTAVYYVDVLDFSNFDTSNVENMNGMFTVARGRIINISNFDTSKVTNMGGMFYCYYEANDFDLSKWDTSHVTDMSNMFYGCNKLNTLNVSGWNTSEVTNMAHMFYGCAAKDIDVTSFDTSKVSNMHWMFKLTNFEELDLTSFDTSNVTDMNEMFAYMSSLTKIYVSDKFKTNNVTDSSNMFFESPLLVGGNGTVYDINHIDKEYARIDTQGTPGYFSNK